LANLKKSNPFADAGQLTLEFKK